MKKPNNQNITTNAAGAATNTGRNSGVLAGDASTPAFAKLSNINLRKESTGRPGGAGGLSALLGNASSTSGNFGNASRSAVSKAGNNSIASGDAVGLLLNADAGQTPGGTLLFPGGRTLFEREIEASSRFSGKALDAWERSNPGGPKAKRREVGFFATVTGGNRPGVLNFRFSGYKEGKLGEAGIQMGIPPAGSKGSHVIDFHTHPFGLNSAADDSDIIRLRRFGDVTGVIHSFSGFYWYGKEILG